MASELYEDTVGARERSWPRSYDTCIARACQRCKAKPYQMCTNPERAHSKPHTAKAPCLVRLVEEPALSAVGA